MGTSRKQLQSDIRRYLAATGGFLVRKYDKVRWGKFLVYATPADFEKETKTLEGARRAAAALRRAGFKNPIIKRHATDGKASWNELVEDSERSAWRRR